MPLTTANKKESLLTHVELRADETPGLQKNSIVLAEQVRTIDKRRILEIVARVTSKEKQNEIMAAYIFNALGTPYIREQADKIIGMFNGKQNCS